MRIATIFLAALVLSGCAGNATVWVTSQPPGAYVTEMATSRVMGITPVASVYPKRLLQQATDTDGCYRINGFEGQWVSGARAASPQIIRLCEGPTNTYSVVIGRDPSAPGLDKDLQFAMQVQAIAAQQQQAQAAQDAATASMIGAFTAVRQANTAVRCSTSPFGNTVQTVCK